MSRPSLIVGSRVRIQSLPSEQGQVQRTARVWGASLVLVRWLDGTQEWASRHALARVSEPPSGLASRAKR